ncbi:MAG TPA: hypothetical protein VFC23_16495 [Thermoanaerobaculia bacterium]|nr:hypothetical protein [Thermoanaerobaculia bacterium]
MKRIVIAVLALGLASAVAFAKPTRSGVEPGVLETLTGHMDVVNHGQTVVVKLAGDAGDRWFRIETSNLNPLPSSFSASSAEILYWQGHLLLLAPRDRKAVLFSMPGFIPGRVLASEAENLGPARSASDLDAFLAGYEVTRIDTATEITSAQGPRARLVIEKRTPETKAFTQPPNPGGGPGGCGTSCTIACADGSSCSTNCASPRCATCSCPASCTCSF